LFYDAASQPSPKSNHSATQTFSEEEAGEDGQSSQTSSPPQLAFLPLSQIHQSNEASSNSDTESDRDIDILAAVGHHFTSDDQFPVPEEEAKLRGSFQLGQGQMLLQPSPLTIPRSRYDGCLPPLSICKESMAVHELLEELKQQKATGAPPGANTCSGEADFEEFELSNFTVYLPPNNSFHASEMRGLQHLTTKCGHGSFYFDGILSVGSARRYVQSVPFKICSIGNYGEDNHAVGTNIWIQSDLNSKSKSEIYYRLAAPSPEYERYHDGFLWLADLAKHFVDFCQTRGHPVLLNDFRSDFYEWLKITHQNSSTFDNWYQKYDKEDFRRAIAANINFLFKESIGVDETLRSQPIWSETMERDSIPQQPIQEKMTVVTPYVYECFKDIRFGHHLMSVEPSSISEIRQTLQGKALDLTINSPYARVETPTARHKIAAEMPVEQLRTMPNKIKNIKVGDVLSVTKDGQGSVWKDEISRWKAADDCWYVYVQHIHESTDGERSFDCIWLYHPSDTMCAKMKYPYSNELFLSDNCTCSKRRIMEDEILDVVDISWNSHPSESGKKLFIRQTYLENEKFVTLKESHKKCEHLKAQEQTATCTTFKYPIGKTVLVPPCQKSRHGLEPYEITKYISEGSKQIAVLRRLQRRREVDGKGRPNELVYTDKMHKVPVSKIRRTCLVRFYRESDVEKHRIPAPYNRDGTGNAFYITTRLVQDSDVSKLSPIEKKLPQTLLQGFDPLGIPSRRVLRGMDLYCGGGNFGRGLEEGGAVHNEWAVDINKNAIHTYAANLKDPKSTKFFYGSVDDLLKRALQRSSDDSEELIPLPGDVEFISGGSPCQGFSALNSVKNNEKGLKNQSLVASVAAYVDFYRPKYGILENVMTMAQKGRGRDQDVLSQLICAIVGMGYQVQLFVLDAWSCGSPQSRSRLFVSFAAPGLEPVEHPQLSHSHPPKVTERGLGKLANGESFGRRLQGPTPFEYVTAAEATKDLPNIGDGCTYQCTRQPDHVAGTGMSTVMRDQIRAIPVYPRGMNFYKAWNEGRGIMTTEQRAFFPFYKKEGTLRECVQNCSRAWGRVSPKGLFPNIVVSLCASDSRMGTILHWDDHRYLTTMEARRAQSFPDDEILLGAPNEGWKLMGNSVARSVALALGLSLRDAWAKNETDNEPPSVKVCSSLPGQGSRRSGVEIVIPTTVRRSKPEKTLVKASTIQRRMPINSGIASSSLVNSSHRPVAPNKARRSKFVPDWESSISEDSVASIQLGSRLVSSGKAQQNKVIPDSLDTSAEEGNISEDTFHHFLGSLNLSAPTKASSGSGTGSGTNGQAKPVSLKRPHGMFHPSEQLIPERSYKVMRVSTASSQSSSVPTNQIRPKGKPMNLSTLAGKLKEVKKTRIYRGPAYTIDDNDDDDDLDSDSEANGEIKFELVQSSSLINRVKSRTIQTAAKGRCKTPSKEILKPIVISLLTDDEDLELDRSVGAVSGQRSYPSSQKYVPVDNSNFRAYEQTHRFLNNGEKRKRIAVR
jgi:DNA (cytosine-5)-methyltransferase 1